MGTKYDGDFDEGDVVVAEKKRDSWSLIAAVFRTKKYTFGRTITVSASSRWSVHFRRVLFGALFLVSLGTGVWLAFDVYHHISLSSTMGVPEIESTVADRVYKHLRVHWFDYVIYPLTLFLFIVLGAILTVLLFRKHIEIKIEDVMARQRGDDFLMGFFSLPRSLKADVKKFIHSDHELFLLCRKAAHRAQVYVLPFLCQLKWFPDPIKRLGERGFLHSLNDVIVSKIVQSIGAEVKPWLGEGPWFGDAITDWQCQKNAFEDGTDLPLRFVQITPNLRFSHGQKDVGETPKSKYVVMCCLANPIRDPIYILPLKSVLEKLKIISGTSYAAVLEELQEENFNLFLRVKMDRTEPDALTVHDSEKRPILVKDERSECGFRSGFDLNKIDLEEFAKLEIDARTAVFAFHEAIELATPHAEKVTLTMGDILILKNYYVFFRRMEIRYPFIARPTILPKRRWLRVYYTFPKLSAQEQFHDERTPT